MDPRIETLERLLNNNPKYQYELNYLIKYYKAKGDWKKTPELLKKLKRCKYIRGKLLKEERRLLAISLPDL